MLHTIWSVKGGSGVSVVAAATAVTLRARVAGRTVLVDLPGDQPAVLGRPEPSGPGVRDWLASNDSSADALDRLLVEVGSDLWLLPSGTSASWDPARSAQLVAALRSLRCPVLVDAGVLAGPAASAEPLVATGRALVAAGRSSLVIRPCYVALRRYTALRHTLPDEQVPDDVVLVVDEGRALSADDIATVLDLSVVATVQTDPAIARAVDAGTLLSRAPRSLGRSLRNVA